MAPQPGAGSLTVVPANHATFGDVQAIFGTRGQASRCQCQRYKLAPLESFGSTPVEERAHRLRVQISCGDPGSPETSGLVTYLDGVPVGWCAVEPRCNYESLLRNQKVPWSGRDEDKQDCTVWAITCLFARAGFRRQGISRTLIHAAVRFARGRGARAIEAYPMTTAHAIDEELHCGLLTTFLDAGFTEVTRPAKRRAVVRVELASREDGSTHARKDSTMSCTIRPLDASTWGAFAELVERNNGIFGGCWCIGYHPECGQKGISHRAVKEDRVRTGRAHAALVLDEDGAARGWCQYGSPEELPGIKHKRQYEKDAPPRPDWRITCLFVDKGHRRQGIARAALEGALDQIAHAGGGLVEAISEVTTGREAPGRFLFSATVELLEQYGFSRVRQVGKHAWIVSRVVDPV